MKPTVRVEGLGEVLKDLEALPRRGREASVRALDALAERVVAKTRPRVPVDDEDGGQLRASVRKTKAKADAASGFCSVSVLAGGAPLAPYIGRRRALVYPIIQHDDASLKHNDGEALFMHKSVQEEHPSLPTLLEKELLVSGVGGT